MQEVTINKNTVFDFENGLKIDGRDYSDYVDFSQKGMIGELKRILDMYKKWSSERNTTTKFDVFNATLTISEYLTLTSSKGEIIKEKVAQRFHFLEETPYFVRKFQKGPSCYYQYMGTEKEFGEIQYIYIRIPLEVTGQVFSNFKIIKNGKSTRVQLKDRPRWFKEIYEKAKEESREMHKLRRLFLRQGV